MARGHIIVETAQLDSTASQVEGCADTYNLTVEGGSTYPLYYTATLIG